MVLCCNTAGSFFRLPAAMAATEMHLMESPFCSAGSIPLESCWSYMLSPSLSGASSSVGNDGKERNADETLEKKL